MFKKFLGKAAVTSAALLLAAGMLSGCSDAFDVANGGAADAAGARVAFVTSGDRIYAHATSTPASDRLQFKLKCASTIPSGTEFTFYTTYNCYSKFPSGTTLTVRDGAADPYTKWTTTLGTFGENTGSDITDGWYPVTVKTKNATKEIGFTFNGTFAKDSVIAIKNISIAQSFAASDWKRFETNTEFSFTEEKPDAFKKMPGDGYETPDPVDPPAPGNLPVKRGHKEYNVKVNELSGINLSKDGDFLWGVDDNGGLYQIQFDGSRSVFWSNDESSMDPSDEFEGVAMDPVTHDLYIGLEDKNHCAVVVPYKSSGYDKKNVKYLKGLSSENWGNSGVEGITWYKDNQLYYGTQQSGAPLYLCKKDGTVISTKKLHDVKVDKNAPSGTKNDISEVAGLDYDPETDRLWVIDSETYKIYLFNGNATLLLATYSVEDYAWDNPESLCVDKANKCIWVAEDISGTSKLHKYTFDNL